VRTKLDADAYNAPTVAQRTMVMPPAAAAPPRGDTSETQILEPARRKATPAMSSAVDDLAARSRRRRGRGWWVAALIVVLVAAAGGTGWYFGLGPGAHSTIPNVAGDTVPVATAALTQAGLEPLSKTASRTDPDVAVNAVSGTSPAVGATVVKGAKITIIVSLGPALLDIPTLTGLTESQAATAITNAHFLVGNPTIKQFDPKVEKGKVVDFQGSDGKSLLTQKTYSEKRVIILVISAGPLPKISGLSVSDAEKALTKAGLNAVPGSEAYDPVVPQGQVIGVDPQTNAAGVGRTFRVGDTQPVLLITSRGPQPVLVPSVAGESWPGAKAKLLAAGFKLVYPHGADTAQFAPQVKSTNPKGGTMAPQGSTITVTFFGS
jgi:serine/threonine-protein kinase